VFPPEVWISCITAGILYFLEITVLGKIDMADSATTLVSMCWLGLRSSLPLAWFLAGGGEATCNSASV
jgi:hypothetical protein